MPFQLKTAGHDGQLYELPIVGDRLVLYGCQIDQADPDGFVEIKLSRGCPPQYREVQNMTRVLRATALGRFSTLAYLSMNGAAWLVDELWRQKGTY